MAYDIGYTPAARRQIKKLERADQEQVIEHIDELSENPRRSGVKKLGGMVNIYRYRTNDFRIIFEIDDRVPAIFILKVGDRKEVYR